MIHIIIAIIRAIIRHSNKPTANVSTTAASKVNYATTKTNFSSPSDDKKGLAIIIAILSTFCCSLSFLVNIVLAIVTKKTQQIFISLAILFFGIYLLYAYDTRKTEVRLNIRPIVYNDTLQFELKDEDVITSKIEDYLAAKYSASLETTKLSSSEKANIENYYRIMAINLLTTNFSTIQVASEVMTYTSIDQIWQDQIARYESDDIMPIMCKVYMDDETVHNALAYEEGKIKEKISSSQYLTDNIMRMNIGGFCILFLLTFMQGLYLWIQFFKQRNPANAIPAVENTNLQKEYTPQVTTNNLKAQEVKQRVSTKPVDANKPAVEVVSTPAGKMDINHIDVYQLLTIPGLSYSQALLIISERTDKGNYSDIEELILRNKLDPTIGEMLRQKIYFSR